MRFWLTIVIGVAAVAGVSTALLTITPNMAQAPGGDDAVEEEKVDPNVHAIAEIVGERELKRDNLGQQQQGRETFRIRNAGKTAKLRVAPRKPTCHCTHVFLADREYGPTEEYKGTEYAEVSVDPGKEVFVIVDWDTKDKLGEQRAGVPVVTNDPKRREITFTIVMNIQKELLATAGEFGFGTLNERETGERTVKLTSLIRDKLSVESMEYDKNLYAVSHEAIGPEELARSSAKAGITFKAKVLGKHPVGSFRDPFVAMIVTPRGKEKTAFQLTGTVAGDIVIEPDSTILDFKEVTESTNAPQKRDVFVRKPNPGETFKLGTVKPEDTITATLEKHPKLNMYKLVVRVKPTAPAGKIDGGYIGVVDNTGRERVAFRAVGFVDPQLSRRTAAK
jgi:hypothetical protein